MQILCFEASFHPYNNKQCTVFHADDYSWHTKVMAWIAKWRKRVEIAGTKRRVMPEKTTESLGSLMSRNLLLVRKSG